MGGSNGHDIATEASLAQQRVHEVLVGKKKASGSSQIVTVDVGAIGSVIGDAYRDGGTDARQTIGELNETIKTLTKMNASYAATIQTLLGVAVNKSQEIANLTKTNMEAAFLQANYEARQATLKRDHEFTMKVLGMADPVVQQISQRFGYEMGNGDFIKPEEKATLKTVVEAILTDEPAQIEIIRCAGVDNWKAFLAVLPKLFGV